MIGIENYIGFLIAGIILNITPGPDSFYIITRSIAQGRQAGIYSVLGIVTGALVHTLLAAFGLSMILMKSVLIFNIIKWLGVTYLIYLGIKMLIDKSTLFENDKYKFEKKDLYKIYRQGFLTNLLNPKVAIFFVSLLPQFINPKFVNGPVPFLILGGTFIFTGTIWCLSLVYSASYMTQTLRTNDKIGKYMQKASGLVYIGLGLQLLLKQNK